MTRTSRAQGRWSAGRGPVYGVAAAMLFGLSAPVSKLLLAETSPLLLASLLYLGAGIGLVMAAPFAPRRERHAHPHISDVHHRHDHATK